MPSEPVERFKNATELEASLEISGSYLACLRSNFNLLYGSFSQEEENRR